MSAQRLTIIGGGPGGYVAAIRAAQLGLPVTLIERDKLGGVCLNWGCIPTKSLLRNAEVARLLGEGRKFGFSVTEVTLDYSVAVKRSRKVSARLVKGVDLLLRKNGVKVIRGEGRLITPHTVAVTLNEGGHRTVESEAIILATGSRARAIPGVTVDGERVLTAREALERRTLPVSAIIIGAGPIGLEFATIWSSYGTDVTVVEMQEQILPTEDAEAAQQLARALRRQRIKTHTSTRVESVTSDTDRVHVQVSGPRGAKTLHAELALIATGVRPNSEELGLTAAGVATNHGWVTVDEFMRTNVLSIYAIGDLNGVLPLAHVASAQGILAVEQLAGQQPAPFNVNAIPRGTYTSPQVASFGLNAAQAREQGLAVAVGSYSFMANGKALGLDENQGFVKIVAEQESQQLLGAVIVGPEATELLPELVLAQHAGLTPTDIARAVHAHPTLNEVTMEAAHNVFGKAIHSV
ncbi:MAG: dihydrolipoyl dehydrogenase [Chloroflexota bacterium]|nr:dihydrolipoyl dehydrogenase [Chloroflexota bacterium]